MDKKKKQNKKIEPKKINPNKKPLTQRPKNKMTSSKPKATPESKLSDLENTLDLNIQILKTFYQNSSPVQSKLKNDAAIIEAIDKIKKQYLKKKELFKQLKEKKSKSLIESQIYTEKKRKLEEMKDVYQDKIGENEEGLNSKEEVIKKVQKRLKEVEVYIHKLTLNMPDKKRRQYYQSFLINDFLDVNNGLARQKDLMTKKVDSIRSELQATVNENKLYKNKSNEKKTNYESEIKINESKNTNDEKIKDLSDKEFERLMVKISGKGVFQSAKELRQKQDIQRDDGTIIYIELFNTKDWCKNNFQVTHQTTVEGKYTNRYDVTILINGLPLVQIELKRRGIDINTNEIIFIRYNNTSTPNLFKANLKKRILAITDIIWKGIQILILYITKIK